MKKIILVFIFFFCCSIIHAQLPPPFYEDIQAFKKQDSINPPSENAILFVGSSSFTKWTDVQHYFPKHTIINRGFGGSTLQDVVRYASDVITPYHAKQIVIYCGENDVAYSDATTPEMVLDRFKQLFKIIRDDNPAVPVAFISLKPSPSRKHLWVKMKKANQLIKKYLAVNKKTTFINVWPLMFNKDGSIMKDIFVEDDLHMNVKGYHIWQKAILPYLVK
jgi:lysophospholipase L1-like esterase